MKKEELLGLGLTEEQANEVFKLRGKEIENHKAALAEANEKLAAKEEELTMLTDNMIKEEDYSKLKSNANKYKALVEQTKKEYESKISQMKYDVEIEKVLSSSGAKDINIVKSVLDSEAIKFEDGKFEGLTEQLEKAKESYSYLFEQEAEESSSKPKFVSGGKPDSSAGGSKSDPFKSVLERHIRK